MAPSFGQWMRQRSSRRVPAPTPSSGQPGRGNTAAPTSHTGANASTSSSAGSQPRNPSVSSPGQPDRGTAAPPSKSSRARAATASSTQSSRSAASQGPASSSELCNITSYERGPDWTGAPTCPRFKVTAALLSSGNGASMSIDYKQHRFIRRHTPNGKLLHEHEIQVDGKWYPLRFGDKVKGKLEKELVEKGLKVREYEIKEIRRRPNPDKISFDVYDYYSPRIHRSSTY